MSSIGTRQVLPARQNLHVRLPAGFAGCNDWAVSVGVVNRSAEMRAIARFFSAVAALPSGLLLEGEAGMGKTTLWLAALHQARAQGFHVMSARAWGAEAVVGYGTVADL